ncbi:MAG: dihydrofolate reductase [Treponema sp.]|nr:dihydrofolate reductase [Treponema sp.]
MDIIIIAAMAENRVIGKDNALPWSVKGNLARFKEITTGWPCVMGRKTWESLPKKPLPGRLNIIISGTMIPDSAWGQDVHIVPSLPAAVGFCAGREKIFICGGESVYRQSLELANKIDLTLIRGQYEGDRFFPEIDPALWEKTGTVDFDGFSVINYSKVYSKEKQ